MTRFDKMINIGLVILLSLIIIATVAQKEFSDWKLYACIFFLILTIIRLFRWKNGK